MGLLSGRGVWVGGFGAGFGCGRRRVELRFLGCGLVLVLVFAVADVDVVAVGLDVDPAFVVAVAVALKLPFLPVLGLVELRVAVGAVWVETCRDALLAPLVFLPGFEELDAFDSARGFLAVPLLFDGAGADAHAGVLAAVALVQELGTDFAVEREETFGGHHDALVFGFAVLDMLVGTKSAGKMRRNVP